VCAWQVVELRDGFQGGRQAADIQAEERSTCARAIASLDEKVLKSCVCDRVLSTKAVLAGEGMRPPHCAHGHRIDGGDETAPAFGG
jgi:hypothetical protein